ncbi:hypothetical protein NLJ89_g10578 [Agrocybe chaxingu]|uniref:BTB domain-containing protein n=1 Tax=Agrocybe chaxingu TaxID=84603 RepID=A0A9W8JQG9_9AGAR|nr:hypothetical protein NLJ89_g10578 [Agrocybe chaxingu]
MMDGSPQPTTAEAPFDSPERADVVLRSSDKVDFYVLKAFLAFSSPVLRDKFAESSSSTQGLHPVFSVKAGSGALRVVLLLCYPRMQPRLENTNEIIAAYAVAQGFKMEAVMKELEEMLLMPAVMKQEPLRIFAIAIWRGWERIGMLAAKKTLALPFILGEFTISKELTLITGSDILHLFEYRQKCVQAICDWFINNNLGYENPKLWKPDSGGHSANCMKPGNTLELGEYWHLPGTLPFFRISDKAELTPFNLSSYYRRPGWWLDYVGKLLTELYLCPSPSTVLDDRLSDKAILAATNPHLACPTCCTNVHLNLKKFKVEFAKAIEEEISKVCLSSGFCRRRDLVETQVSGSELMTDTTEHRLHS